MGGDQRPDRVRPEHLSPDEKADYMALSGIEKSGLDLVIHKCYRILDLVSFFTYNEAETRAWTIPKGSKAPRAAGVIHTDFERGFIRAQTIGYSQLLEAGSLVEARNRGWLRSEGKEYEVAEGDVMEFLFNV